MPIGLEGIYHPAETVTSQAIGGRVVSHASNNPVHLFAQRNILFHLAPLQRRGRLVMTSVTRLSIVTASHTTKAPRNVTDLLDTFVREGPPRTVR